MLSKWGKFIVLSSLVFVLIIGVSSSSVEAKELNDDLVLWYKFDQTDGRVAVDSSGNENDAVLKGGASWDQGWFDGSVRLDGNDGYVKLPGGIFQGLEDATITTWYKQDKTKPWQRIFDFGSSPDNHLFLTATSAWNDTHFSFNNRGDSKLLVGPSLQSRENWRHVALVIKGDEAIIYIDGQELIRERVTIDPGDFSKTTKNYIGKSRFPDPFYNGRIDDFRIYNRALDLQEIWSVYAPNMYHKEPIPKYTKD